MIFYYFLSFFTFIIKFLKTLLNFKLLNNQSIVLCSVIISKANLNSYMNESFMTLLFFPDWTNGLPSDFLILHFFIGAIIFPFNMIHAKARRIDSQNPEEAANGYKNSDKAAFFGYEEIN